MRLTSWPPHPLASHSCTSLRESPAHIPSILLRSPHLNVCIVFSCIDCLRVTFVRQEHCCQESICLCIFLCIHGCCCNWSSGLPAWSCGCKCPKSHFLVMCRYGYARAAKPKLGYAIAEFFTRLGHAVTGSVSSHNFFNHLIIALPTSNTFLSASSQNDT